MTTMATPLEPALLTPHHFGRSFSSPHAVDCPTTSMRRSDTSVLARAKLAAFQYSAHQARQIEEKLERARNRRVAQVQQKKAVTKQHILKPKAAKQVLVDVVAPNEEPDVVKVCHLKHVKNTEVVLEAEKAQFNAEQAAEEERIRKEAEEHAAMMDAISKRAESRAEVREKRYQYAKDLADAHADALDYKNRLRNGRAAALLERNSAALNQSVALKHSQHAQRQAALEAKQEAHEKALAARRLNDHEFRQARRDLAVGKEPFIRQHAEKIERNAAKYTKMGGRIETVREQYKTEKEARLEQLIKREELNRARSSQLIEGRKIQAQLANQARFAKVQERLANLAQERAQYVDNKLKKGVDRQYSLEARYRDAQAEKAKLQDRMRSSLLADYWTRELELKAANTKKLPETPQQVVRLMQTM